MNIRLENLLTFMMSSVILDDLSIYNTSEASTEDFLRDQFEQLVNRFRFEFPGLGGRVFSNWDNSSKPTIISPIEDPYTFSRDVDDELKIQSETLTPVSVLFTDGDAATSAKVISSNTENYTITAGVDDQLRMKVEGGAEFTATLDSGDQTVAQICASINAAAGTTVATTYTNSGGQNFIQLTGNIPGSSSTIYLYSSARNANVILGFSTSDTLPIATGYDVNTLFVLTAADVVDQINTAWGSEIASIYTYDGYDYIKLVGGATGSTSSLFIMDTPNQAAGLFGWSSSDTIPIAVGSDHTGRLYLNDIDTNLVDVLLLDYASSSTIPRYDAVTGASRFNAPQSGLIPLNNANLSESVAVDLYTDFIQNEWSSQSDKPQTLYDEEKEEDYILPLQNDFTVVFLQERRLTVDIIPSALYKPLEYFIKYNIANMIISALSKKASELALAGITANSTTTATSGGGGVSADRISSVAIGNLSLSFSAQTSEDRLSTLLSSGAGNTYMAQLLDMAKTNLKLFNTEKFIRYGGMIR